MIWTGWGIRGNYGDGPFFMCKHEDGDHQVLVFSMKKTAKGMADTEQRTSLMGGTFQPRRVVVLPEAEYQRLKGQAGPQQEGGEDAVARRS